MVAHASMTVDPEKNRSGPVLVQQVANAVKEVVSCQGVNAEVTRPMLEMMKRAPANQDVTLGKGRLANVLGRPVYAAHHHPQIVRR